MISVIIPTYNRNEYLFQAVNSVLKQKNINLEIIIIDDNPNNDIQSSFKSNEYEVVKYFQNIDNIGPGESRKKGLNLATGNFVVFMDDDDYYTDESFFFKASECLSQDKDLSFVGFSADILNQDTGVVKKSKAFSITGKVDKLKYITEFNRKIKKPLSTFTSVFRKEKLLDAGAQNVEMLNDTVIYLRALIAGDAFLDNDVIGHYRVHDSNITKNLSIDFILQNVIEKERIANLLNLSTRKKSKWLYNQAWSTINYYIENMPHSTIRPIIKWVNRQDLNIKFMLYIKITYKTLKLRCKAVHEI